MGGVNGDARSLHFGSYVSCSPPITATSGPSNASGHQVVVEDSGFRVYKWEDKVCTESASGLDLFSFPFPSPVLQFLPAAQCSGRFVAAEVPTPDVQMEMLHGLVVLLHPHTLGFVSDYISSSC